ncbi:MAG: sialidase family protein [Longimicrobiales bacterium]|nr:sialidase family protein [Longimicrobiales bacterium]
MRRTPILLFAVLLAALAGLAACDRADAPPLTAFETVASPAAPGSGEPNLTVDGDGVAYLSWIEPSSTGDALRFARWEGRGWGPPRTIIDRPDLFVNWADFPSLAVLRDGTLAAHWLEKSGPGAYSYDVRMAFSRDDGEHWTDEIVIHDDGLEAEHGFVSLVPYRDRLAALWLDGRATVTGDPMTLRFATVDREGGVSDRIRVDSSVCDCCQTALAATADGLVAAYRDRSEAEIRDIYVARYVDGRWLAGRAVHDDGWEIAGCPVNGPALDTRGDTVAIAWFTAADTEGDGAETRDEIRSAGERGRTLAAFSTDGGRTFGPPIRVDDGRSMGRVDVVLVEAGAALVTWLERTDQGAEVRIRAMGPAGVGPAVTVAGAAAARAAGFPRVAHSGDRLLFAWTASGEDGGVRTAVATLPEHETTGGGGR